VGGLTLTPLLRRLLNERIPIQLDTKIDPMTVVARGAALYAAHVPLETPHVTTTGPIGAIELQLSYSSVSDDTEVPVGGKLAVEHADGHTVEIRRADGGWTSARVPLEGATFFTTVVLARRQANVFELNCFDAMGARVAVTPDRFAITQGLAAADPPLSKSISVVALGEHGGEELIRMLDKGTVLPAVRERSFRTTRDLRPGQSEGVLNVHVLEGNRPVGI
jgi:molecular chaperone DnaK